LSDCVRLIFVYVSLHKQKRQKMDYLVLFYTDQNTGITWYLSNYRKFYDSTFVEWVTNPAEACFIFSDYIKHIKPFIPENNIPVICKYNQVAPAK